MKTLYTDSINTKIGPLYIYVDENGSLVKICFEENPLKKNVINNEKKCLAIKNWLIKYFNRKPGEINFNLNLKGTEFQKTVWQALIKIPWGKTISYKKLAEIVENPGASRAVGNALNANPIPIIIPCHRVIMSNGQLGGFGGGIEIKKQLIKHEAILRSTE
jgi:methylated-DNA-[protein]-cysteine S-methyltransferase